MRTIRNEDRMEIMEYGIWELLNHTVQNFNLVETKRSTDCVFDED